MGNMFAMDGIPETYNECIEKFNLQVAKKGTHQHLMFVFMIQTSRPLGVIKSACFPVLKQHNRSISMRTPSPLINWMSDRSDSSLGPTPVIIARKLSVMT
eukprot:scaffold5063_cov82-Cylindrotheca_fusiformis.AAC.1